ncbi:MAG TPA: peptidylprolyl isomerase [Candidatus Bathyarchaeia archaeon]|nr:peptidylprolyl isomerase [Candidatus Bathyarchaeia archaeon]
MPSPQKRRIIEKTRRREKRGRVFLVALVLIIIAVGIGWYVYSVVTAPVPDFTVAAPVGVTIVAGSPTISTITVTAVNQFSGTVLLTVSGSTGLNATINPASITGGSGTAKLTTTAANNGSYTVTVTAKSGGLTHSVTPRVATPMFATLSTTNGTIMVELYPASAPKTVANFVSLAQRGFYQNLVWHRIVKGFVIQTGDPTSKNAGGNNNTWGQGGSQQTVPLEIDSSLQNLSGYLGMARSSDPNSGSSQFYINLADNHSLDGNYTVFGKVITGMNVALTIGNVAVYPRSNQPINPVFLTDVTIR